MATLKSFEELECWKSSQDLLVLVYHVLSKEEVKREFSFQDQLKRATLSVSNNIAEGFDRKTPKERIRFLVYASGSLSEVKSMLYSGKRLGFIDDSEFESTFATCNKCHKQLKAFMRYLGSLV